jgi:hypothetical protein
MRRRRSAVALPILVLVLALAGLPSANAQVLMLTTGSAGSVSLLDFAGGYEDTPTSQTDARQAAVVCSHNARGRKAVFAGGLAWAADLTTGLGNDWQYVRVVAGAVDASGQALTGDVSPFYVAHDNAPATLPAVTVLLPKDDVVYTPVFMVQFYDSTYALVGSTMLGGQTGAWMQSPSTPPVGDRWYVAQADLVQCT